MTVDARRAFQASIRDQLLRRRRMAYRGPVVLRLRFQTTERNPGHIHNLTKNFLDLLKGDAESKPYRPLLYRDDRQVCGLVVSCQHGSALPSVVICARSLSDFRADLGAALRADSSWPRENDGRERSMLYLSRIAEAQGEVLRNNAVGIRDLAYFYRAIDLRWRGLKQDVLDDQAHKWEARFSRAPFRITVGEPPSQVETSALYREEVADAVRRFREEFARVLTPLLVPVALEVVVKPPPAHRARASHDLDNLLRDYLIPSVVEVFQPPSHYLWAIDRDSKGWVSSLASASARKRTHRLPKSSAVGLVRIEAWRISRAPEDDSPGFVSLALVADDFGYDDSISRVDHVVDTWTERILD